MTALLTRRLAYRGQSVTPRPRWFVASSAEVKQLLGFRPEQKWPADGLPAYNVQGVVVKVKPILITNRGRRKPHRVQAMCPVCDRVMSLGRLGQHLAIHPTYVHQESQS